MGDGFGARLRDGMYYAMGGAAPQAPGAPSADPAATNPVSGVQQSAIFGAGQPSAPLYQSTKGRRGSYPVYWNTRLDLQRDDGFTPDLLRTMASDCWQIRGAIETRKDQISKLAWRIRIKDRADREAKQDHPAIKPLTELFERPQFGFDFGQWIRALLEDHFVLDYPAVWMNRAGKKIVSMEYIDGGSIRPLIDDGGRTPLPPGPSYQQFLWGTPANRLSASDVCVYPHNPIPNRIYPLSHVEQIGILYSVAVRREKSRLQWFTEGTIPDGMMEMDAGKWTPEQLETWDAYWQEQNKDTGTRRELRPIPGKYVATKEAVLKDMLDEWITRAVVWFFSLPPTPFVGQVNRATAETVQITANDEGFVPLTKFLERFMTRLINDPMYHNEPDLEFVFELDDPAGDVERAQADKIDVEDGIVALDDARRARGDEPYGIKPYIITPQGLFFVDELKRASDTGDMSKIRPAPAQMGMPLDGPAPQEDMAKAAGLKKKLLLPLVPPEVGQSRRKLRAEVGAFLQMIQPDIVAKAWPLIEAQKTEMKKALDPWSLAAASSSLLGIDWEILRGPLENALTEAGKATGHMALAQFTLDDPDKIFGTVDQALSDYAKNRAGELIKNFPEGKTLDSLRATMDEAVQEGWSREQFAFALSEAEGFNANRADLIARTELKFATGEANMKAWQASGVVWGKQWLLSADHPEFDECNDNANAGAIPLDEEFPGGSDSVPAHPGCVMEGQLVLGASIEAASRAKYSGPLIEVFTSMGHKLTVTPNHPVLTPDGWIAAGLLREGNYVVGSPDAEGMASAINPNNYQGPTRIEDIFSSFAKSSRMTSVRVPTAPEDFHGDAARFQGDIEVVRANRFLRGNRKPVFAKHAGKTDLGGRNTARLKAFAASRHPTPKRERMFAPAHGRMGGIGDALSIRRSRVLESDKHGFSEPTRMDSGFQKTATENGPTSAPLFRKLLLGLPGLVAAEEIVKIRQFNGAGHVYDLQSGFESLYIGNGIIIHNCLCSVAAVVVESPYSPPGVDVA